MGCCNSPNKVQPITKNNTIRDHPFPNNTLTFKKQEPLSQPYYDEDFKRISSSLGADNTRFKLGIDYQWKRVSEVQKFWEVCSKISNTNVIQGKIQDQYLLNALRILSTMDNIIQRVFISQKYQALGRYQIYLCVKGVWQVQTIDDYFPFQINQPLLSSTNNTQLWVQLIEKVFAKHYGNYCKLELFGESCEAIRDLTGAPFLKLKLKEQSSFVIKDLCYLDDNNRNLVVVEQSENNLFQLKNIVNNEIKFMQFSQIQSKYEILYYIPLNFEYYQITSLIKDVPRNELFRTVVYLEIEEKCHTFITLSQSDLKHQPENKYYAQLSMILGKLENINNFDCEAKYHSYGQIRDLTLECNLEKGIYVIYIEVIWQQLSDYKLSLQSYGSKIVKFQNSQLRESDKSTILNKLILSHSKTQQKTHIYDALVSRTESSIGRFRYILFDNQTADGILKSALQITKQLVTINYPYEDISPIQLIIKANTQEIILFTVKLENNSEHSFSVLELESTLLYPLTDEELMKQTISNPTNVSRSSNITLYEYKTNDLCSLVYRNESQQQFKESCEIMLNNLEYQGQKGKIILNISLQTNEQKLLRFNVLDKKKQFYEYRINRHFQLV